MIIESPWRRVSCSLSGSRPSSLSMAARPGDHNGEDAGDDGVDVNDNDNDNVIDNDDDDIVRERSEG